MEEKRYRPHTRKKGYICFNAVLSLLFLTCFFLRFFRERWYLSLLAALLGVGLVCSAAVSFFRINRSSDVSIGPNAIRFYRRDTVMRTVLRKEIKRMYCPNRLMTESDSMYHTVYIVTAREKIKLKPTPQMLEQLREAFAEFITEYASVKELRAIRSKNHLEEG